MRRGVVLGGDTAAVVAVAAFLALSGRGSSEKTSTIETPVTKVVDEVSVDDTPRTKALATPQMEPTSPGARLHPRTVRISSQERRPGEKDYEYRSRMLWLDRFEKYEKRAQLTPEQREQLLQVMADIQQEAILSIQVLDEAVRQPNANIPDLGEMDDSLSWDLAEKVKPFLSKEQRISLQRKAALSKGLGYGFYKPLDIDEL